MAEAQAWVCCFKLFKLASWKFVVKLINSVEGEALRPVTWVLIEDVASGQWGVGGQAITTDDIRNMSQASQ